MGQQPPGGDGEGQLPETGLGHCSLLGLHCSAWDPCTRVPLRGPGSLEDVPQTQGALSETGSTHCRQRRACSADSTLPAPPLGSRPPWRPSAVSRTKTHRNPPDACTPPVSRALQGGRPPRPPPPPTCHQLTSPPSPFVPRDAAPPRHRESVAMSPLLATVLHWTCHHEPWPHRWNCADALSGVHLLP